MVFVRGESVIKEKGEERRNNNINRARGLSSITRGRDKEDIRARGIRGHKVRVKDKEDTIKESMTLSLPLPPSTLLTGLMATLMAGTGSLWVLLLLGLLGLLGMAIIAVRTSPAPPTLPATLMAMGSVRVMVKVKVKGTDMVRGSLRVRGKAMEGIKVKVRDRVKVRELEGMGEIRTIPLLSNLLPLLIPLLIRGPASTRLPQTTRGRGVDGTQDPPSTTLSPSMALRAPLGHMALDRGRMALRDHRGRMEDQDQDQEDRMGRTGTLVVTEEGEVIRTIPQTAPWTMALLVGVPALDQGQGQGQGMDQDQGQDMGQGQGQGQDMEGRGQIIMSPLPPQTTTSTPTRPNPPTVSSSAESLLASLRNRSVLFPSPLSFL